MLMYFTVQEGYKYIPYGGAEGVDLNKTFRNYPGEYIRVIDHEPNESDVRIFFKEIKKDLKECKKRCFKAYRKYAKYEKNLNRLFNKQILEAQNN